MGRGRRHSLLAAGTLAGLIQATALVAQAATSPLLRAGDVVAANIGDHSVSVFDGVSGAFRGYVVAPSALDALRNPTGVAFGPDGNLYVASSGTGAIIRFDGTTGAVLGEVGGETLERPFSMIFAGDGDILVSSGSVVLRLGAEGRRRGYAARDSSLVQPIGLALGPDGLLYVANSTKGCVQRFDPASGGLVDVFAADSLSFPSDVAFGPDGDLYVSSASGRRVVRFDGRTGSFEGVVATLAQPGVPMGLAFSSEGNLFVSDFAASRLFLVTGNASGSTTLRLLSDEGLTRPENIAVKPVPVPGGRPGAGRW